MIGQTDVRLGKVGEETPDELGRMNPRQLDGASPERDRLEMLTATSADAGEVAEDHGVDVGSVQRFVDRQGVLVGADRSAVVGHRLVDRSDRVEDSTLVDGVIGCPVDLQGPQAVIERAGMIARLVVDDADQMERPRERQADLIGFRELDRFRRERERVLGAPPLMSDGCELVERFGFRLAKVVGTGEHTCVECELPSPVGVDRPT